MQEVGNKEEKTREMCGRVSVRSKNRQAESTR